MTENKIHLKNVVHAGVNLEHASKALIMIHGRGANAEDILSLANHLNVKGFALLAPQASNYSWYPYSFMAPAFAQLLFIDPISISFLLMMIP
jgi:phospholipase/carboxylesterase